jgi:hypothetical protein
MPSQRPLPQFLDAAVLAYRLGYIHREEERQALLAAARAASDNLEYLTAVSNFGVKRNNRLFEFLGKFLAAPAYYRAQYPQLFTSPEQSAPPPAFLNNSQVLPLLEPVLTDAQQQEFYDTYWWFVKNYQPTYVDMKKGTCIGLYATEPTDNASTLACFEELLQRLVHHKTQRIRDRFEGFPLDIVLLLLKRAFLPH